MIKLFAWKANVLVILKKYKISIRNGVINVISVTGGKDDRNRGVEEILRVEDDMGGRDRENVMFR